MIRRLLASVLGDRRQSQIMRREQVTNDGKNKTDILRFDRRAHRFMDRDDVLVWLSLVWFVSRSAVQRYGCYLGLQTTFSGRPFGVAGDVAKSASLGGN